MFQKKLEELQSVTKELLDELESKGFSTIESLCWLTPEELSEKTNIDLEIAKTIITEAISNIDQKPVSAHAPARPQGPWPGKWHRSRR